MLLSRLPGHRAPAAAEVAILLPDTNVVSRYLRGGDGRIREQLESNLRFCRLSSVVLAELEYGAAKRPDLPGLRPRLGQQRGGAELVDFTDADAGCYGPIRAHLARLRPKAQPIGPYDLMLAAQAVRPGRSWSRTTRPSSAACPGS